MMHRKRETYYYVGVEIPSRGLDRYRCLDVATKGVLATAKSRTNLIMAVILLAFMIIIGRLYFLTVVNYQARNFKPSVLKTDVAFGRKNILDRNGIVLATNIPTKDLSVNPQKIKDPEQTARALVRALPDLKYDEVYEKLTSSANFKYIKRNINMNEWESVLWVGNPYLEEVDNEKRVYPQGRLFAHILGGVNVDNIGIAGLEKAHEDELQQGDITLSLDTTVQGIVRRVLTERIQKYQAVGGFGIVMDVNNGEVLALVSLPDYDPEQPATQATMSDRFNKATVGTYEFGSVFKLFNTAMALENGDIRPTDSFDATRNSLKIGKKIIEDFNGGENRSLLVPEILMHSSNIGSARIALKAGWQKQKAFFERLGFYDQLDIDLPEKARTQVPKQSVWPVITSATAAYGYGISVSALHVIAAVSAIANGGYYHTPTFIKGGNDGKPEIQVISPNVSEQMRHMMWAVINWDIKKNNPVRPYAVGGKTGTADMMVQGKYNKKSSRTSFVGVFPMNRPEYAVLVTIEDPKKIKENWYFNNAGWTAKPTGEEIIAKIAPYLGVMPQERWEQPAYIERAIQVSQEHKKRK
ncbi:MAG: penicillin-binding protein 2 [Alphaproteobacteria bacterium]|nr:penicillin-binding protein 2 [Alphaproteobacteria bacterium]